MECLDEDAILGFCEGVLDREARSNAEEHIAVCDECRILVSAVARSSVVAVPALSPDGDRISETAQAASSREDQEDRAPAPILRRVDAAMAPTTPIGGEGLPGPSVSPVQPGQILAGKFEVERVLGAGGMGIVVAARHTQLDQRVALKFLLPVACEVPGAVARFLREGRASARITSEHVARVMDTGVLEDGAPYLVMEYLEGADLGALICTRGTIPQDEAIDWVLQACEAIVEAHELGIVHRDLKPANLFLSHRADGSPLVKVLDFGISKLEGGSRSHLTSASVLMGSPRYMSPEQMLSAKDVDARTDIWALGVILYELVTGKAVWQADTLQGLCALIASAPAPSLLTLSPDASPILADVIGRCLTKARDERIGSIADLVLALAPIAPDSARTSIERILRVARRERGALGPRSNPPGAPLHYRSQAPVDAPAPPAIGTGAAVFAAAATTADTRSGSMPRVGAILGIATGVLLVVGIAVKATVLQRPKGIPDTHEPAASATGTGLPAAASVSASAVASASPATAVDAAGVAAASALPATSARRPLRAPEWSGAASARPLATVPAVPLTASATAPAPPPASAPTNRALSDRK